VGRVVFATRDVVGRPAIADDDALEEIERHHAEVGAYLLGLWGFPSHIVAAVALHHAPSQRADAGLDLTALVHIADRLTRRRGGKTLEPAELGIEPALLEGLGLVEHLPQWLGALDASDQERAAS
jgi:HD superfamily phosphohydrolase YqeK